MLLRPATLKNILIKQMRCFSSQRKFKEVSVPVSWGQIAGKWWEPYDTRPILSIHGWQDNCQSFDRLIPLLNEDVGFLAIDLPGHGYSSRLPTGMYYHYINYILTVRDISDYFGWPKISLMGHSLGAIKSYIFSSLYPDEVDFLICLDAIKPKQVNILSQITKSLGIHMKNSEFLDKKDEPPSYTIEEIKNKLSKPIGNSVLLEYTPFLMERNIAPSQIYPGKYYFTRDPRVKSSPLVSISEEDLVQNIPNMSELPIFFVKASESPYFEKEEVFLEFLNSHKKNNASFEHHHVEGKHHVHLNNPECVAPLVKNFIQKYNLCDRSQGGLPESIIQNVDTIR